MKALINDFSEECDPVLHARQDVDCLVVDDKISAREVLASLDHDSPESTLLGAMGSFWVLQVATRNNYITWTEDMWRLWAVPWLSRYATAYRARISELL